MQKVKLHSFDQSHIHTPSHYELLHQDAHTTKHGYHPLRHESHDDHKDMHFSTYHPTHGSLDHAYDDQRDVEPVHFHEHAVHHAFDHADSHDYSHTVHEAPHEESHFYEHHYSDDHEPMEAPHVLKHHPRVYTNTDDHTTYHLDVAEHSHELDVAQHGYTKEHDRDHRDIQMTNLPHERTPFEHDHPGSEEHYEHGRVEYKPQEEEYWGHWSHSTEPDYDYTMHETPAEDV